ncbi:aminopeptidase P N-terminal domain-containing protein [Pararhodonellum marinum]|uniref:aminopeptidase P N-terminal domain-containing protein n=1 Tax=Pararhodonellum marinum TaxID=2755358 RepID=UPI0018900C37|nr:aminopeptidase P N-terminal domain-containing protein [Pararhodonellum marinum]
MSKKSLLSIVILLSVFLIHSNIAQSHFEDGLGGEFHKKRRKALREMMPPNSMAVIFTSPVKNRSNDVDFIFHPNTDFFYLTGFREPNAVLLVFSEKRSINNKMVEELIFVQNRDELAEMWNGKRLGVEGVKEQLDFEEVFLNSRFGEDGLVDFAEFDKILTFNLTQDIEESKTNKEMLDMVTHFKAATGFPEVYSEVKDQMYELIRTTDIANAANVAQIIGRYRPYYTEIEEDKLLNAFLDADSPEKRLALKADIPDERLDISNLTKMMTVLREVKMEEEIELLKKAVKISAIGQVEVMKAMKPGMSEREIQGIHEFIYKRYGAEGLGYPSIVGGGNNGCILHYIENDKQNLSERLVLMDLGAEWRGYTADVTRTIPVSGKFTQEEKAIYDLVFKAQEAGISLCLPGTEFSDIGKEAQRIINEGLVELGIIKRGQRHKYFPHGTSHHLGLDVHDRGSYGALKVGMVLTVEPGIYIPEGSDCDPKWWGIAVRIEDDILVTANGPENLSEFAPRKSEEIEKMMAQPSVLENWVLPEL